MHQLPSAPAQTHFLTELLKGPTWQLHTFLLNDYKAFKTDIERIWIWKTDPLLSMVLNWVRRMLWSHIIFMLVFCSQPAVFLWMPLFFLYFLLPLNVRHKKHPSVFLLVFHFLGLPSCVYLRDRQRCFHSCAGHDRWWRQQFTFTRLKSRDEKNQREIQNRTLKERKQNQIHLIWEAPQMLKGFDNSADGHWPDLSLIMDSPEGERKARVHKISLEHKQNKNQNWIFLQRFHKAIVYS